MKMILKTTNKMNSKKMNLHKNNYQKYKKFKIKFKKL